MVGMLASASPAESAVIYSVNGLNAGQAVLTGTTVTSFTASKLYVGFGTGSFTTDPANIVGGMLIGSAVAGTTYTTNVILKVGAGGNVTMSTAATTFTGGFAATSNNYGTFNNGGGFTLTNSYTYVPSTTGTVRGVAGSMTQNLLGREAGGGQNVPTDTTTLVLISNWVAPVQSTAMTVTATQAGSVTGTVTSVTSTTATGTLYVLPGTSAAATVTVKNVGDGNMAANATTIATGFGNLKGTTTSSTSATGTGGFAVSSSSATFSLNDQNAANIPATPAIVPTTSTTFTYTYTGNTTRNSSAAATLTVNFNNGNTDNTNASQTAVYNIVGRTVAPVQSITTSAATLYALPNQVGPTQTMTITNIGDGSFVGAKLTGTNTASQAAGVTVSNTGAFSLTDTANGAAASSASTALTLSFTGGATRGSAGTVANITSSFTNGNSAGTNAGQSVTTTFTGQTVAPVQSVTTTNTTIYALPTQTGTTQGAFKIANVGDGSRVGATLNGSLSVATGGTFATSAATGTFTGLKDGTSVPADASTLTQTLTYTGAATRNNSTIATVTASFSNGNTNNTNAAQSVAQTFTGITVAPVASTTTTGVGSTQYVLVGSGATVTGSLTVKNTGDGTFANTNLAGTLANTLGAGFSSTTAAGTINLGDSNAPGANGTSLTQTLTYTAETTRSGLVRTASSVATFSNGNASGNNTNAASATVSLSAQSVAPLAIVTTTLDAGTVRVGATSSVSLTVKNTGDGNLAGADNNGSLKTNLRGTVGAGSGSFAGSGGALNLTDTTSNQSAANASATYLFTYAPTARTNGASEAVTVTTALQNGANASNSSGSASTTLKGSAQGPVYESKFTTNGATTTTTGTGANQNQVYGGTILFGDFVGGLTSQNLLISNITNDKGGTNLTTLSLTSITISGNNEYSFSLNGFNNKYSNDKVATSAYIDSVDNGRITGSISIQFNQLANNFSGGQLQILTDEGTILNGNGTVYIYDLRWTVPEPGTIMVFGTALLGFAISRRRRRGQGNEAVSLTAGDGDHPSKA